MRSLAPDTTMWSPRCKAPIPDPNTIVLPIFAGQGTSRTGLKHAADQAIRDADSSPGSLLLSSCLDAFLAELAVLSPEERDQIDISPADFDEPRRLLIPDPKYAGNHIITGTFLFLAQILRYQSYVRTTSCSLLHLLQNNIIHTTGVLGLSSGILPACVVTASHNSLSYITTAVEVFRLVFWIGLRVLQTTRKLVKERLLDTTLPWSVACLGLTRADVEQHMARFEQKHSLVPSLRVTAVLDERNVTVSGRPDLLVKFSAFVSRHCSVCPTTVDALYHSDLHLPDTRDRILADVQTRNIQFPDFQDLRCPLRSTISGDIAQPSPAYPSLVHLVLDMVLVCPVNWDLVVKKVASAVPPGMGILAVNIGPGSSTLRALERVVPECVLRCVDATSDTLEKAAHASPKQEPIAIIGMAAHTPGAVNTTQLWELLETGVNTVSKLPNDRFELFSRHTTDIESSPCEVKVETGNFISDFADFDHKFFKVSPREARSMDPQQRILLHTAYEALESSGYVPDATPCFRRATFGCYIGAATQDYAENLADNIDIHYSTGTLRGFLSGRISYAMQFGGPSVVVDTACSSSIVAIHQACRALMIKDCNAALAGGVNIMTSPNMFIGLERGHFLSPSGQCKSFDASSDGYSRGEGCCVFVLKRLSDAIAENDNIMGVIRGVEVNQSGLAPSITHPHNPTQINLLKMLLDNSRINPTRVSVIEAHGTGTEAGDACEVASIRSVLSHGRSGENLLHITSIKGNIGHLEAASGTAGLCKLLLMLKHNLIPAQVSLKSLHPHIPPMDADHTVIDTCPVPWGSKYSPRIAVLNNFGAAGSNGALILEEYVRPKHNFNPSSLVFGISAKSSGALENLRSRYAQWFSDARNCDVSFCDIAYTATARRQLYPFRLAVTASDKDEVIRALVTAPIAQVEPQGGKVMFVFSGQGSQYLNMGGSLYAVSPVFKNCIDRCQRYLLSLGYSGILPIISSGISDYVPGVDEEFEAYQCAILAVEFGLATLWKQWGVDPAGVIGQSLGEYAAMVTADVLSIETALSIVAKRARLMSRACAIGKTGMSSINLPSTQVQDILAANGSFSNLTVACVNTESSCVVAGPIQELQSLAAYLASAFRCKTVPLQVPLGFHSSAMDPILDALRDHVATLTIHPPSIPIASNVYGTVVPVGDGMTFRADYFSKHCRQPVLFSRGLRELEQYIDPSQIAAWIDVGPHAICLPMVEATLSPPQGTLCLPSILKETPGWDSLMGSLAQLYRTSVTVNWRRVFDERAACSCVDLPTYPFDSQKFWVPYSNRIAGATSEPALPCPLPGHPMLTSWSQYPSRQNGNAAIFETPISYLASYIEGHKVGGYAMCPASVYLEQVLAGAVITQRYLELDFGRSMPVLRAAEFSRPLVHRPEIRLIIRTHVTVHQDGTGSFSITSRLDSSREEHVHVYGDLRFSSVRETTSNLALELTSVAQLARTPASLDEPPEVFNTHAAYEVVFPRVVEYSKDYRTIQSLTASGDGSCGIASVSLSTSLGAQSIFLDTMLHVAGFMTNMRGDISDAYICSGVAAIAILRDLIDAKHRYTLHCNTNRVSSRDCITADVIAVQECDSPAVVAQLRGAQFRRVRLTSLHRGLAIAADPGATRSRTRTDSNSIIAPSSPRSVIFGRSRSNTLSTVFCGTSPGIDKDATGADECYSNSSPLSPGTLVSEGSSISEKHPPGMHRERIRSIMAEVLGITDKDEIKDDLDFESLGLDSLGSIEVQQALRVALNRPVPYDIFSRCPTLSALCDSLEDADVSDDKAYSGDSPVCHPTDITLVSFQQCPGSSRAPLYLMHDGSGLIGHYERISPLYRDVWGIDNPRFFSDEPWETLGDMAQAYAQAIEEHGHDGAMILGGWSFGGVVAFEVARILVSRGVQVKGVVLIDSPPPFAPPLLSDPLITRLLEQERTMDTSTISLVARQFKQNTALLEAFVPRPRGAPVSLAFLRCTAGFCPDDVENVDTWFRERGGVALGRVVGPWETLIGGPIPVWDIPGHHFEPFSRARVNETSVQLDRACRYLETL